MRQAAECSLTRWGAEKFDPASQAPISTIMIVTVTLP
jgi:hypothetical protein